MKPIIISTLLAATLGVTACANSKVNSSRSVTFDGQKFAVKLSKGETREAFSIVVRDPAKTLTGAREAGRYGATKYCIKNYGRSDVIWSQGPDDDDGALNIVDGNLHFSGRCKGW